MLSSFGTLSVRSKMAIAIALSIVVFSLFLYLISALMLLSSYRAIERTAVTQDVKRVEDAIGSSENQELIKLRDWAQWDDAYQFGKDHNATFVDSIIVATALANLDINLMLFADTAGKLIAAKQIDLVTGNAVPASSTVETLLADPEIAMRPTLASSAVGLVRTPEGVLLFASRPLSTTAGEGPSTGSLLFGRFLDEAKLLEIAEVTHLPVEVFPYDAPTLPADVASAKAMLMTKDEVIVTPLSFDSVGGYAVLYDFQGKPALLMRIVTERPIYAQGQLTFYAFLAIGAVALLFFGLGMMFLLDQFLIARFVRLEKEVGSISNSADLTLRLGDEGTDEVGKVAKAINELLNTVASARSAEAESGKRMQALQTELDTANRQMEKMKDFAVERDLELKKLKQQPPQANPPIV